VARDFAKLFGERVRELRKRKGLSQEAFADSVGLERTYISGIERGCRNPSLFVLKVLADALDTTLEKLFKGL
jgi:transcriptional regulator with XRE-family HTH domain